ncbi:MAG TPA: hypothetical protein VHA11_09870, partial [Bryobacteraceae bacterium]|nr:hypothetical protein [Bryobacteraceae bacterium]
DPKADSMVRNGWEYASRRSYRLNSYQRPGAFLRTLENHLGETTMARVMRTYHQRWRYRHPDSLDFLAVVNEVSGRDVKWFFDQFVFGSDLLDYAVGVRGSTVRIRRRGEAIMPVEVLVRFRDGHVEKREWDGRYRWKNFRFPEKPEIESVEIDPGHKILLDANFANNSYTRRRQTAPLMKWDGNLLFWAQQLLLALAGVA